MAKSACPSSSMRRGSRVVSGTTRKDTLGRYGVMAATKAGISSAAVASAMVNTKVVSACAGTNTVGCRASCKQLPQGIAHHRPQFQCAWRGFETASVAYQQIVVQRIAQALQGIADCRLRKDSCTGAGQAAFGHDRVEHLQRLRSSVRRRFGAWNQLFTM